MKLKILISILNIIARTWKINFEGNYPEKNTIISFWHGNMLPVWYYFKDLNAYGVVSKSKDGSILSQILENWNYKLIRGSSSKGGKEVLNQIIENLLTNYILITPDGPRGPKEEFKPGIFIASQRTQKQFYFIDVSFSSYYKFEKAWDKFKFPYPFSNINLKSYGPYVIPESLSKDELSDYIKTFKIYN